MNKKVLVLAGVLALQAGVMHASADQGLTSTRDYLGKPASTKAVTVDTSTIIITPNQDVIDDTAVFFDTTLAAPAGTVKLLDPNPTSEKRYVNQERFLHWLMVRIRFYETSHRWELESLAKGPKPSKKVYGGEVLHKLYNDYVNYFETVGSVVTEDDRADKEAQFLKVLADNADVVDSNELRDYMNTSVDFALREAINSTLDLKNKGLNLKK